MKNYIIIEWKVNQLANRMLCLAFDPQTNDKLMFDLKDCKIKN